MSNGKIHKLNKVTFPFDDITLSNPQGLQGGAYFSKIKMGNEPIIFQTIKCKTKNGLVKTEKKIYCDLMFKKDDDNVVEFIENLEDKIKNLIYDKKDNWFHSEMDMDTIEYHWQRVLRTYKGDNILLRCFVKKPKGRLSVEPTIQIYDEDESVLKLDDITKEKSLMTLLELSGLKFTAQSFSLEFNLVQVMILKEKIFRNKCLIKVGTNVDEIPIEKVTVDNVTVDKLTVDNVTVDKLTVDNVTVDNVTVDKLVSSDLLQGSDIKENQDLVCENIKLEITEPLKEEPKEEIEKATVIENDKTLDVSDNLEEIATGELLINMDTLEENDELSEINLAVPENGEIVKLKKPNEVYMEIYREVKRRAKDAKKKAIAAYLEAKRIKSLYLLDEIESSDDETELLEITRT